MISYGIVIVGLKAVSQPAMHEIKSNIRNHFPIMTTSLTSSLVKVYFNTDCNRWSTAFN